MSDTIDFGIDLGTTNSSIGCCRRGEVRVFPSNEQMAVTPSVVSIGKTGRILVGKRAYDAWTADPENTQAEFKRWMGFSDKLLFPASNRVMTAEELSAEVLKSLRADALRATGEEVTSSVITVPAAFGVLQCEATGRAAKLAGFEEAPLLQEPLAAAIAYGASAAGAAQRWMVFDLGGGTLDIAVVSTRNGRLAVLEHQGNNRLGGKDMDRAIAERLLLPALAQRFKLPDRQAQPAQYDRLFRKLVRLAEQAKVALSTAPEATVDVFEAGDDLAGAAIEMTFSLYRSQMEKEIEPLVARCVDLARRALEGARLSAQDVDRVILVGGPTQMPMVRSALTSLVGARLDHSIDPMTVVAQGAALYASTLERQGAGSRPAPSSTVDITAPAEGPVILRLNHERASGTPRSPVAGWAAAGSRLHEVKIDAEGGVWTSGWIPLESDRFVTEVMLSPGKAVTRFVVSGRGKDGSAVAVEPAEFAIAFMLPMSAPPLPHTIAIELATETGKEGFDAVFKRHTPLPAEAQMTFKTERTLRPSDVDATLPIKFWEIEVSEDPNEKWWAGCVHIQAMRLKRLLTEGSEISLTVKIDKSRKMTVEAFVPALNQAFAENVYVPDPPTARTQLQQQLDLSFDRLNRALALIYAADREDLRERANAIQKSLEEIAERFQAERQRWESDPDAMLGPTEELRRLRMAITQLEEQLEAERSQSPAVIHTRNQLRYVTYLAREFGTEMDRKAVDQLADQFMRYAQAGDQRGVQYVWQELMQLKYNLVKDQWWYYEANFDWLKSPGARFLNQAEAQHWLAKGESARECRNLPALREAVGHLWGLQPPDDVEQAKDQAMRSGLKKG
jgi:molecular chaperone DnaK